MATLDCHLVRRPWAHAPNGDLTAGRSLLLAVVVLLLAAHPGWAQKKSHGPVRPAGQEQADRLLDQLTRKAQIAVEQERLVEALDLYNQAFALRQAPLYQLRIAECHRRMGNAGRAAFAYRQYLRQLPPDAADRGEVEDLLKRMECLAMATRGDEAVSCCTPDRPRPGSEEEWAGLPW